MHTDEDHLIEVSAFEWQILTEFFMRYYPLVKETEIDARENFNLERESRVGQGIPEQ